MKRYYRRVTALASLAFLAGCSGSKLSVITNVAPPSEPITVIAMAPSGGILADAVAFEFLNYGLQIFDTNQTSNLLVRLNLSEVEVMSPSNLNRLSEEGFNAIIFVRTVAGYDDKPQSASIRVQQTTDGRVVAGVSWQNGSGFMRDSPLDMGQRKDVVEAAEEIAEALARQLRLTSNRDPQEGPKNADGNQIRRPGRRGFP